jgi:nucleoside-diphosphate-sugar epimerase
MTNILVIGGSYFAGRVFVEELRRQPGTAIHVFNRGRQPLGLEGVTELVGDRDNPAQIRAAIPPLDWDAVVDFCAYEPDQVSGLLDNLPGRVGHYIFISTTTVYDRTSRLPVGEDAAKLTAPQPELGDYGAYGFDKWRSEQRVTEVCARLGIPQTIFRPAIIYGCYNYAPRESYFFERLVQKRPIEIPDPDMALYSFVWVVDMARMLIQALGRSDCFGQVYNLAGDELVSYGRIIDALGEITGKPVPTLALSVAEIERRRLPLPFPLDQHLLYCGRAASTALGVPYTPFVRGLRDTLKYYLAVSRAARGGGGG